MHGGISMVKQNETSADLITKMVEGQHNAYPIDGTFGAILYDVVSARYARTLDEEWDRQRAIRFAQLHAKHIRAHARYCSRHGKKPGFDPRWKDDIRHYELDVIMKPYYPAKFTPDQQDEIKEWFFSIDDVNRAALCDEARSHWRDAKVAKRKNMKNISKFSPFLS